MSIQKLKQRRHEIEAAGIGTYLDVVQDLFSAIDEHAIDANNEDGQIARIEARYTQLQIKVSELTKQLAEANSKLADAQKVAAAQVATEDATK